MPGQQLRVVRDEIEDDVIGVFALVPGVQVEPGNLFPAADGRKFVPPKADGAGRKILEVVVEAAPRINEVPREKRENGIDIA